MTTNTEVGRRRVLGLISVGMLAAAGGGVYLMRRSPVTWPPFLGEFDDVDAACRLGRAYLESRLPEADPVALLERLDVGGPSAAAVATTVAGRIREEFRVGDVVDVEGWQLSTTEARVYAAVALRQGVCFQLDPRYRLRRVLRRIVSMVS